MNREALRWLGSIGIFYVAIPAWIVFGGPVLQALLPFLPRAPLPPGVRVPAALLALVGAALAVESMRSMVVHGRGHPFDLTGREPLSRPTERLLSTGVWSWTRNPMGLGDTLLYAGLAGLAGSAASLLVNVPLYALVVCLNHRWLERPRLVAAFGEAFLDYERNTSCLFPGPRTLRGRLRRR